MQATEQAAAAMAKMAALNAKHDELLAPAVDPNESLNLSGNFDASISLDASGSASGAVTFDASGSLVPDDS